MDDDTSFKKRFSLLFHCDIKIKLIIVIEMYSNLKMPQPKHDFSKNRKIFRIIPFLCLAFTVFFIWHSNVHDNSYQKPTLFLKIDDTIEFNRTQAPLVVDMDCLKNLDSGKNCQSPIKVAVPVGQQFADGGHCTRIEYNLRDNPARGFWFFHNIRNATESVATKRFKTILTTLQLGDGTQVQLEVPTGTNAFARAWRNGRFIECQPVLIRPKNVSRRIPLSQLDNLVKYADLIAQFNATPFIFSGWRRECSLIPHTQDIDMAIFYEEHSNALLHAIFTSPNFVIHWTLGRLRNSFELTVIVDSIKMDLFYLYNHNNHTFTNGMRPAQKQRLRFTYPRLSGQICTGELHGRLVHVPCDYQKVIEADYGREGWQKDWHTDKFIWDRSHKNREDMEIYTEEEWKNVFVHVRNKSERFIPAKVDEWLARINKTI